MSKYYVGPVGRSQILSGGSVMEVHHPVFYVSLGHMQNSMRSSVTLKLKLTLTLTMTLTDTGGAVLKMKMTYYVSSGTLNTTNSTQLYRP